MRREHRGVVNASDVTANRGGEAYFGIVIHRSRGTGRPFASPVCIVSRANVKVTSSKTLRDAVRQDLIVQNPASVAQAPRRARGRPDVWTESQVILFLSQARASSANFPLYLFIAGTGVRVGEALGLAWQALDLREGMAHIEQALQRARGGGYLLRDPKSVRSRRTIALPPEIVGVLRDLRVCRDEERRRRGCCAQGSSCITQACPGWHETGLVFTQPNGKPFHANNLRQRDLHRLCRRLLGCPHAGRSTTCVTLMPRTCSSGG